MKLTTYLKYLFTALIIGVTAYSSFAGGFPVRPGRLILSPSVSYFFANKEWDSTGVKKSFPEHGKFTSISLSLYAEYGITRRFAVVALLPYVINNFQQTGFNTTFSGLTDAETGIKYYLANINYVYYFSLQATAITPLYKNVAGAPQLGYGEEGAELKLSMAGSGNLLDRNFYFNVEDGFRQYFGALGPYQDRYSGTFGLTLDKKLKEQISVSVGGFYTFSNYKAFNQLNPSATRNFAFNQVSLTYGHSFSRLASVFITGGQFITGRNTGDGTSASLSLVYRLGN
jgi:hypothetical protein